MGKLTERQILEGKSVASSPSSPTCLQQIKKMDIKFIKIHLKNQLGFLDQRLVRLFQNFIILTIMNLYLISSWSI